MAPKRPRRLITVAARTLLGLLLLLQLGVIWVIAHTSPTRLPAAAVDVLAELVSGAMDFDCREATVDRNGRIRLGGVRLSDSLHPDDAFEGDLDVLPDWSGCLLGSPRVLALQVRGRVSLGGAGAGGRIDDIVARLGQGASPDSLEAQVAGRIGALTLSLHLQDRGEAGDKGLPGWDRALAVDTLRWLRSLDGAVGASISPETTTLEGGFAENPAAVSPLPVRIGQARFSGQAGGRAQVNGMLNNLRAGEVRVARAWFQLDKEKGLRVVADGVHLAGSAEARLSADGRWKPGEAAQLRLRGETPGSRLDAEIEVGLGQIQLRHGRARLAAEDLAQVAPLAEGARRAGIDLCGVVELLEAEATWSRGTLAHARTLFALSDSGWGDIRPALVRPEQTRPTFEGALWIDLAQNRLELTDLDLAGIQGEIRGGLREGDNFDIRLGSAPERPVNPPCLNTLLGAWWIDLWSRFDLATRGTRPSADVRVTGRWGDPASIRTDVQATLSDFGFMGARFRSVDLAVSATARETRVRVRQLRGELEGKDAGGAHGTLRWDWQRTERRGQPELDFDGDINPALVLRLHDPALAARLKACDFGQSHLQVSIGPDRPLRARLESAGDASLGGVRVGKLAVIANQPPGAGDLSLEASGVVAGGKVALILKGDLQSRNQVQLSVREWNRSGIETFVGQLKGGAAPAPGKDPSQVTLLYTGSLDLGAPWNTEGEGRFQLVDPNLKTLRLLGPLSSAFDLLGIGFSNYELNEVNAVFRCAKGQADLSKLEIEGDGASIKLKGAVNLQNGVLRLAGNVALKDSPWGPLKYLNPNRLIANMINVKVTGDLAKPEVRAEIANFGIIK